MIARRLALVALLAAVLAAPSLAACGGAEASADEPPEVEYGTASCSRCHMIISEERFAAGVTEDGEDPLLFDDPGELITALQEEGGGLGERRAWVHDFETKEWLDATTAFYVDSHDIISPMGTGIAAFADRERAGAFAAEHAGIVRDWQTMLTKWTMHGHAH
jgi:copper chaperone NosL